MRTVHAPHSPRSQPILVPVSPRTSRKTYRSDHRGSTISFLDDPLMRRLIVAVWPPASISWAGASGTSLRETATVAPAPTEVRKPLRLIPGWESERLFSGSSHILEILRGVTLSAPPAKDGRRTQEARRA